MLNAQFIGDQKFCSRIINFLKDIEKKYHSRNSSEEYIQMIDTCTAVSKLQ